MSNSSTSSKDLEEDARWPIALRKGRRACTQNSRYTFSNFFTYERIHPEYRAFLAEIDGEIVPETWSEALRDPKWQQAMNLEMEALEKNRTWELVQLPDGKEPVGCRWVYTIKHNADGSVERYKARLVAKGYTQTYGISHEETFAPVAKLSTVRILVGAAATYNWKLHQYDVKNAFLHGDLAEEIYMQIPPGYYSNSLKGWVCKIKKALYGLKQAPRAWFGKFSQTMLRLGYDQSDGDHTLFVKANTNGKVAALLVYVDDIIISGDDEAEIQRLSQKLCEHVEIKSLGLLRYFLGIEFAYSPEGIFISQRKYILDILRENEMEEYKPSNTPIDQNVALGLCEDSPLVDPLRYRKLIEKLIYLNHTRPDVAFTVNRLSQYMRSPREPHLEAAYKLLAYLKGTAGHGLLFRCGGKPILEAYTDSDYGGSVVDSQCSGGYCTYFSGNLITWRSKKQREVCLSTAEAEFRALLEGICEVIWIQGILEDLHIPQKAATTIWCDSKSAIDMAHNPVAPD